MLEAARRLGSRAQFRMVGAIQVFPEAERALRQHVELTGPVPRAQIAAQYAWADVLLLPSICEGSATVTYEAMAQGVPVVCTPQTGSVVRDGRGRFPRAAARCRRGRGKAGAAGRGAGAARRHCPPRAGQQRRLHAGALRRAAHRGLSRAGRDLIL
ncbi:MAG: glycosyltransferase [Verrucomicrobiota bacterium]